MTADLSKYTDLHIFAQAFPERFFQMGMAEQLLMGPQAAWRKRVLPLRHYLCGVRHPSRL
jgi:deoxyxylulose-5-phosphate synthase